MVRLNIIRLKIDNIRESVGVTPVIQKMVENRLRWFKHVERRSLNYVVRRVNQTERGQIVRNRGIFRKTIREIIKKRLEFNDLDKNMILNKILW